MCDKPDANSYSKEDNKAPRDLLEGVGPAIDAAESEITGPPITAIRLHVNGISHRVEVEDRWTLAELLRDQLDLTGTKIGCNRSECGACTVLMNGKPVYSCSQLAVWADGTDVQTVEGLAQNGRLSPLQQAFIDHNAPQCGFCTPGQLMTATALLNTVPRPDVAQVKQALIGNLCRCSNYNAIVEAVVAAAAQQTGTQSGDIV